MTKNTLMGETDGFRGPAMLDEPGSGIVNEQTFAGLSAALTAYVRERGNDGPVVIAQDTRESGEPLRLAAINGIVSQGSEVIDLEIVPTPLAQRVAQQIGAAATIVITASHNRESDNGWKGMVGSQKPGPSEVKAISDRYWDLVESRFKPSEVDPMTKPTNELISQYLRDLVDDVERQFGERPLTSKKIVVDGAHGAGAYITPIVLENLGAEVYGFACGDGEINNGVGATNLDGVKDFLRYNPEISRHPDFLGVVANDGDADRVMGVGAVVNGNDTVFVDITGNHMMWALSRNQDGIVGTEYTNSGLLEKLDALGVDFEYCSNGDVNVTAALRKRQSLGERWTRGGEFTGHLVDTNWLSSGDGVRMAAWFAAWASMKGMTFADIHAALPLWHESIVQIPLSNPDSGIALHQNDQFQSLISQVTTANDIYTRIVARPSGTEPIYRIWAESQNHDQLHARLQLLGSAATRITTKQ